MASKIKQGGHFGVLIGKSIFLYIIVHSVTNSGKPQVKTEKYEFL